MPNEKTPRLVSFTSERLRALDDTSMKQFQGRVGQVLTTVPTDAHVCVEFPADGTRRPVRLERVSLEFLQVVPQDNPADSASENGNREAAMRFSHN